MNIALATLLAIAVIGLVISVVINVFLVVQHKQSRCVVTSICWLVCGRIKEKIGTIYAIKYHGVLVQWSANTVQLF